MELRSHKPTSHGKAYLGAKVKKSFIYGLLAGSAFSALLVPIVVSAFSLSGLLSNTAQVSQASGGSLNSQTMPLLFAAVNLDPRPHIGGGDVIVANGALVAQDGPSGTVADIDTRPSASSISIHTVRDGDTLSGIATLFDVSVNTIVWANDIKGGVIHPGEVLIILPITGLKHTVLKGETLASLAKNYKADAHEIAQYNDLADSATLAVGSVVIIPNGEVAPIHSPTKSSSVKKVKVGAEPYLGGSGRSQNGYYRWPVAGGVVTQGLHGWNSVDIGAPRGTSIYAAADGIVIVARINGAWNGGYGNYIVVQHNNGTQTLYSHATKVLVSVGQEVSQGQTIATVGSTGLSTGPHLHFEVRGAKNPFAN